jgi:penicillin-binding protein 1C
VSGWQPENNSRQYEGAVPADEALARSLNIPAVRSLRRFGIARFAAVLKDAGFTTLWRRPEDYGLPLILGGAEVRLDETARAYAALGRAVLGGKNAGAAYLTLRALSRHNRPEAERSWERFAGGERIAWKTGTSFGNRDAWAVGVTPAWTVAVWVGNATGEGRPELFGATAAAPVMFEVFSFLKNYDGADSDWFSEPEAALATVEVCAESGFPASQNCAKVVLEEVPKNAPLPGACPYCRTLALNADGTRQVNLSDYNGKVTYKKAFILPPAMAFYYKRVHLSYTDPPPFAGSEIAPGANRDFAILYPEDGAAIYVPREIDGSAGRVVFRAATQNATERLYWDIDGKPAGVTSGFNELEARPPAGRHTLTVVDENGASIKRRFTILNAASR